MEMPELDFENTPDLNKTELTLRVTEAASSWLLGLGAKAIETEVPVCAGWVADLAAFWIPTPTEAIGAKLIPRKPRAVSYVWTDEENEKWKAWKALYRNLPSHITIVHEVKTNRQDFKRDDKWICPPVSDMQILSYVRGIINTPDEFPKGWWVLEHDATGKLMAVRQRGALNNVSIQQRLDLIGHIADRRHNRTANAFFKELGKKHRADQRERKINERISGCMRVVISILHREHGSVEECLNHHFNKKFPSYIVEELKEIWGSVK